MYSTCTFNPHEDEEVIEYALANYTELSLVDMNKHPLFADGVGGLDKCARLYPFSLNGEGHFLALLRKNGTPEKTEHIKTASYQNEAVNKFLKMINHDYSQGTIFRIADNVYYSEHVLDTTGIMTLRSGLLLGTLKKERFEPSQHLAMSLKADEFAQKVSFSCDDDRVLRYLKGETIYSDETCNGWVLVCVDGYPLGFAKAEGHRLKNKIETGHRKL
jgi:NOL1/NOP2/fmu family ribosome biogenesis protein